MADNTRWQFFGDLQTLESELPIAVRQLIKQRLEQLGTEDQRLLQVASATGFSFATEALAAGLDQITELVEERCDYLAQRALFLRPLGEERWPDGKLTARYEFIHALYQETLHQQLTPAKRRRLHQQIGERIECGHQPQTETVAAELAKHFEYSGDNDRAVNYFAQAADLAIRKHAYQDAVSYFRIALKLLNQLPENFQRMQREVMLQNLLAATLVSGSGYSAPGVEQAYRRALDLCQLLNDARLLFTTLRGSYIHLLDQAELIAAQEITAQCLNLAQKNPNTDFTMEANRAAGVVSLYRGRFNEAYDHFERARLLYDTNRHHDHAYKYSFDAEAVVWGHLAEVFWLQGYPAKGNRKQR